MSRKRIPVPRAMTSALAALGLALAAGCGDGGMDPETNAAFRAVLKERAVTLDPGRHRIGRRIPDFTSTDLDGRERALSDFAAADALVIVLRDRGCPVCKRQGPALARLEDELREREVAFVFVNVSGADGPEDRRADAETFGFEGAYLHDPELELARALGARTTTDVFVLDKQRTLAYRGALDDQIGRGTVAREAPANTWARDAIEALLAGEPVAVQATTAPGCFLELPQQDAEPNAAPEVTYHRDVSRILQRNCVECHRDGGAAPFSLETHADVVGRRGMVRFVVRERVMPPWFSSDEHGTWANDRRLSDEDRERLLTWFEEGAPKGDPAEAPLPVNWHDGWQIGTPDVILRPAQPFEVPAEGVVDLQRFYAEELVPEDLWVERLQILPSAPQVVHHATVLFKPPAEYARDDPGLLDELLPWHRSRQGWQFLIGYLPGKGPRIYREGVARFLPKGSRVRFELHYTPDGVATPDRTLLGLRTTPAPPRFEATSRLIRNPDVFVPAGASGVEFQVGWTFREPVVLRSLTPHMHLIGRTFHTDLILPDGRRDPLLRIPEWDPDWQFSYVFRDEPIVPAGARIQVRAWFDNSAENPNAWDPTRDVRDGPQIWDEMLMLALEWIVPRSS